MTIKVNNKIYVLQGSTLDNGQNSNKFIIKHVIKKYNIRMDNESGILTLSQDLYLDVNTKLLLQKSYITWVLECGVLYSTNVCYTSADLELVYNIANEYNTENILLPEDYNNTIDDILNNNLSSDETSNNSNRTNSNTIDNNLDDNIGSNNNYNNSSSTSNNDTIPNVMSNTMGSFSQGADRDNLPAGMSLDESITGIIGESVESANPAVGTNIANKGTVYPIIRVNNYYFFDEEIQYFSMETGFRKDYTDYSYYKQPMSGFLPTMTLIVTTSNKSILKLEIVKNGDRCAVFFTTGHKMIKSMRCDFRITNVINNELTMTNSTCQTITLTIYGELYIPNLRNEKIRYNFSGSARDGLMDAAKRLKLSFFFCDPEDTNDVMIWCCCQTPEDFIKDMTVHAWKNDRSFFESWIDPRYGLSFQNINRLLGEDGLDEKIDMTIYNKAFDRYLSSDAKHGQYTEEETVNTDRPQYKIITNIPTDIESLSPYLILSWRLFNNALAVLDFIGLNCKMQFDSNNAGMDNNPKYAVETSLCINRDKCPVDDPNPAFYVLLGPGRNPEYENADVYMAVSETENSNNIAPEIISSPMSDEDSANILATGGNMLSSGNTHKFYDVAYQHNMRNLLLLQKLYIICVLNGANLSIVRGEKLPVILMDHDKANAYIRSGTAVNLSDVMYEGESGWYIIDGIEWVFDPANMQSQGTSWTTHVKLTRREWPVPGRNDTKNGDQYDQEDLVIVDIGNGNSTVLAYEDAIAKYGKDKITGPYTIDLPELVVTASKPTNNTSDTINAANDSDDEIDDEINPETIKEEDKVANTDIPLTGLKTYMKECYKLIEQESGNKVKLVAARRWAVNADGIKVDGNAFIENHGYYKCVNALGDILYFKSNNSKHLYGEAIDIINSDGLGFTELMTNVIMKSPAILTYMYNNGLSAYIEQAQDDNGVITKHYHIGTDTTKQKEFWNSVKAVNNKSTIIPGTYIDFSNYTSKNKLTTEIVNPTIKETIG